MIRAYSRHNSRHNSRHTADTQQTHSRHTADIVYILSYCISVHVACGYRPVWGVRVWDVHGVGCGICRGVVQCVMRHVGPTSGI